MCGRGGGRPRLREEGRAPWDRNPRHQLIWPLQDGGNSIAHSLGTGLSPWILSILPRRTQGLRESPRPGEKQGRALG